MNQHNGGSSRAILLAFIEFLSIVGHAGARVPRKWQDNSNSHGPQLDARAIHVQSPLVVLPISVIDPAGNFVMTLDKGDFRIIDDGVGQRITSFSLKAEPVAAVIVIQTNESVAPLLDPIHPLGVLFSSLLLGEAGEAAVVTCADKIRVIQNFSGDPETLEKSLNGITAAGNKARLNDALERATSMLRSRTSGKRRIIIVFSDGFDSGSLTRGLEVIRDATAAAVSIYGLRFAPMEKALQQNNSSPPSQPTPNYGAMSGNPSEASASSGGADLLAPAFLAFQFGRSSLRRDLLQQYAAYTGGAVYKHWKSRTLQDQLQRIALEINSQYVLTYVPNTLSRTGFHSIQVEVSKAHLRVRTRAGYFYGPKVK
jgi:VWFA-related protein